MRDYISSLKRTADLEGEQLRGREGFVLPVAISVLVILSLSVIAALLSADDEGRSARAMRESSTAFYAAEAGMHAVYAGWSDIAGIDTLDPGESITLDWVTLAGGSKYRATIHRYDDGVQPIYQLEVESKGPGVSSGQRMLTLTLTSAPGGPGSAYKLGECCEGAATVRGEVIVDGSGTVVDGHDSAPASWGADGVCADSLYDKPGINMQDTSLLTEDPDAVLTGLPPFVEDPTIGDQTFSDFGPDLTWDEIKDMADFTWGSHGGSLELVNKIRPSYNADGSCNTSDPYNWGSNDASDPCFNFFPIILVRGDFSIEASYGQAVFILDYYESGGTAVGAEFDLDDDADLNGIILGKGCVELKDRGAFHGAIFVDGNYTNPLCGSDVTLEVKRDARLDYSQCAVDRAILNSGLEAFAEPSVPGKAGGVQFLLNRAFGEVF
jgi:hypothetical protein